MKSSILKVLVCCAILVQTIFIGNSVNAATENAATEKVLVDFTKDSLLSPLVRDTTIYQNGTSSARFGPFTGNKMFAVPLGTLNGTTRTTVDLTPYYCFKFQIYSAAATNAICPVLVRVGTDNTNAANYLLGTIKIDWTGWKTVQLDFSKMSRGGNADPAIGFDQVYSIEFYNYGWGATPDPNTVLYFDNWKVSSYKVLMDFTTATSLPSPLVKDTTIYQNGTSSARFGPFTTNRKFTIPLGTLNGTTRTTVDLTLYNCFEFQIYSAAATNEICPVIISVGTDNTNSSNYIYTSIKIDWTGWKTVQLEFSKMSGNAKLNQVYSIEFYNYGWGTTPDPNTVLYFDNWRVSSDKVLTDFTKDTSIPSPLVRDTTIYQNGTSSARFGPFTASRKFTIPLGTLNGTTRTTVDLTPYKCFQFQIYSAAVTNEICPVIISVGTDNTNSSNYIYTSIKIDWTGWKTVQLDFSKMSGNAKLNQVYSIEFYNYGWGTTPDPNTVLYFDNWKVSSNLLPVPIKVPNLNVKTNIFIPDSTVKSKIGNALTLYAGSSRCVAAGVQGRLDRSNTSIMPYKSGDTVMIPVKAAAEKIGAAVSQNFATVTVNLGSTTTIMTVGNSRYMVNGVENQSLAAPVVNDNVVYAPMDMFANALGKKLYYNPRGLVVVSDVDNILDNTADKYMINEIIRYTLLPSEDFNPTNIKVLVDGQEFTGFQPTAYAFGLTIPYDIPASFPKIELVGDYNYQVINPTTVPGYYILRVSDKADPGRTRDYIFNCTYKQTYNNPALLDQLAEYPIKLQPVAVTASAVPQQENIPENTIDGNLATKWAADGQNWIRYDLGGQKDVGCVALAFGSGDTRVTWFEIEASNDGTNWTNIYSAETSGKTLALEYYKVPEANTRYLRIVVHGSSTGTWNSLMEAAIFGK